MSKLKEVQSETTKDVLEKLNKFHRCLLIRPTGFGKTKISTNIIDRYRDIIFCYPTNHIKRSIEDFSSDLSNIIRISYNKLARIYSNDDEFDNTFIKFNSNETLFIFDEVHFIGAPKTSLAVSKLINNLCPNANFLGATATPARTDGHDIIETYFNNIKAYDYSLEDAINDGIFIKPHYVYTPLNIDNFKDQTITKIESMDIPTDQKDELLARIQSIMNSRKVDIQNLDKIIRDHLDKFETKKGYYKFILFFSTFKSIHTKIDSIVDSFKKVFPDHTINTIIVSSETEEYRENLNRLDDLKTRPKTIDLIFSVNMITFGFHVNNITGVMMFRRTISNIIYTQQVGRCLSVSQTKPTIIFDFVENLYKTTVNSLFDSTKNTVEKNPLGLVFPEISVNLDSFSVELLGISRLVSSMTSPTKRDTTVTDHLGNVFPSQRAMCRHYDITVNAFRGRIKNGWTLQDTLSIPMGEHSTSIVDHMGNKFDSEVEMYNYWGIPIRVGQSRKKKGWDTEKILTTVVTHRSTFHDHLGEEYPSLTQLCNRYGITIDIYRAREKRGLSLEEILTTPIRKKYNGAVDHLGNKFQSENEMYNFYGISPQLAKNRKKHGWSLKDILTRKSNDSKILYYDEIYGDQVTTTELSKRYGVKNLAVLRSRFDKGISFVRSVEVSPFLKSNQLIFNLRKYDLIIIKRIHHDEDEFECYFINGNDEPESVVMTYEMIDKYCIEQYVKNNNIQVQGGNKNDANN